MKMIGFTTKDFDPPPPPQVIIFAASLSNKKLQIQTVIVTKKQ
jgi:hypothetical protein